jgi:hypothetical protein
VQSVGWCREDNFDCTAVLVGSRLEFRLEFRLGFTAEARRNVGAGHPYADKDEQLWLQLGFRLGFRFETRRAGHVDVDESAERGMRVWMKAKVLLRMLYYACFTTHALLRMLYYACFTTHALLRMLYYACFTTHAGPGFRLGIRSRFGLGHVDANEDELLWFRLGLSLGFG